MEDKDKNKSTLMDTSPLFNSWNSWYFVVVICNIITVAIIYFYFNSI